MLLATLVILAAAGPLWNPPVATTTGATPLALLIDDGFGAAASWDARLRTADDIIAPRRGRQPRRRARPARRSQRATSRLQLPAAARVRLKQLKPKPYAVERTDALPTISRLLAATPDMEVVWLSDGVDLGRGSEFVAGLASATQGRTVSIVTGGLPTAHALAAADNAAGALTVKVLRASTGGTEDGIVRALDLKGLPLGETRFAFKDDERETEAEINLPVEIRNDIARLEIAGERSAGAVQLLDKRWRRRTVGIVSGSTADTAQPLLASTYYLVARAQSVRRRAARRCRVARRCGAPLHRAERADDHPGRRRQRLRRSARPARPTGSRTAACWCASPARASPAPTTISCR